jgi:hypothetical protein
MARIPFLLAATLALTACGSDSGGPSGDDDDTPGADAAPPDGPPAATTATLTGSITRSATPQGDAKGHIYVAIFDKDPVANMATAQLVAQALIENSDLSAAGAKVSYRVADIPTRAEDYFVVAFLDDNGSVNPAMPEKAGPDKGDLVSLDGLAAPKVKLTAVGDQAHDIVLNSVLPF